MTGKMLSRRIVNAIPRKSRSRSQIAHESFMLNGIINVYKEAGFTSHDVVAKLRGITKQKKIGHTGTLDPDATGVLPVCLGRATKVAGMLTDTRKTYECVLLLGITTDTQDISGTVLQERPWTDLCGEAVIRDIGAEREDAFRDIGAKNEDVFRATAAGNEDVFRATAAGNEDVVRKTDAGDAALQEKRVEEIMQSFLGPQMQIPPMYSALKKNGRKLYELAREGKTVEREPRPVHFYDITVKEMNLPRIRFSVTCSRGTYIRTLCHDIGEKLGCGGCMESLVRTEVGPFRLEEALSLKEIEQLRDAGKLTSCITPVDALFSACPALYAESPEADRLLHNGNPVAKTQLRADGSAAGKVCADLNVDQNADFNADLNANQNADFNSDDQDSELTVSHQDKPVRYRIYDAGGVFVGLFYERDGMLRPDVMFYDAGE